MNALIKNDPFARLLAKRIRTATLNLDDGPFEVELREGPSGVTAPIFENATKADDDPTKMTDMEVLSRLLGATIHVDGLPLTYERVQRECGFVNARRMAEQIMPAIMALYDLPYTAPGSTPPIELSAAAEAPADLSAAAVPEKKDSQESPAESAS
jgi:hypothetical protein